jgi:hypothetical protein
MFGSLGLRPAKAHAVAAGAAEAAEAPRSCSAPSPRWPAPP